nr:ankyrin repeat protein [Cedratvirus borely]
MQAVYEAIFSFSGGHNFLNGQVCREFRDMLERVHPLLYADTLLAEGKKPQGFSPCLKLARAGFCMNLVHLLQANKEFIQKDICAKAAAEGKLEILQWAAKEGYNTGPVCNCKAHSVNVETSRWEHGCFLSRNVCSSAASGGYLEILQWARANNCYWDEWTCSVAAAGGHLEVLKWVRANGCPWDESTCSQAALKGHLEILQWVRANGCPWNKQTCYNAARNGHLEILQWARANGCPWDRTMNLVTSVFHPKVTAWMKEN